MQSRILTLALVGISFLANESAFAQEKRTASPTHAAKPGASKDAKEVRHLFVAKLLLRRMEKVDLTSEQSKAFNKLSANLRTRIDKKRAAVGITKETIKRRDKVYAELKKTDLKGDAFWNELQEKAGLTAAQRDIFRETVGHYAKFHSEALGLLTKEQRARLPKAKRKR